MSRRQHRKHPADPEPWRRLLPPELHDNPKSVAWAKVHDEAERTWENFKRDLMNFYSLHRACPLDHCRRARRCAGRELLCYEATLPMLQKRVFPKLRAALNKRRADADMQPESRL